MLGVLAAASILPHNRRIIMANPSVTVPCPHGCGNVSTYQLGGTTAGASPAQCNSCHKSFWIEYQNGQVKKVRK